MFYDTPKYSDCNNLKIRSRGNFSKSIYKISILQYNITKLLNTILKYFLVENHFFPHTFYYLDL